MMVTRAGQLGAATAALLLTISAPAVAQTPTPTPAPRPATTQATPPATTSAFPTFEVSGGYQLLHAPDQTFPFGLNVDGTWNAGPMFGMVGEIGWAFDSEDVDDVDVNLHAWNFGVGPRATLRSGSIWPYAQVLVGGLHARASADIDGNDVDESETRFMLQPGAGVSAMLGDGWGVVGAIDYRRVFLDEDEDGESGENEFRIYLGVKLFLD
jgi:opacity protein-like surface antigen